ncbi:hypothetical protein [Eubacterium sp. 1001713B170207_170306_E7]|uniref:hypothetical protein n=1 Tax=Eubacterium sp. 1001713B170207_170306_E7 TaxID=2787097 RepID=UPI00189803FE|nr:hypothetical protein [Eubacterium sp. 1001713B170207_170306_E7]
MTGEDKRTVHGYRIINSMIIGSQEIILGEKQAESPDKRYLCAYDDLDHLDKGCEVVAVGDYFEVLERYTKRIQGEINTLRKAEQKLGGSNAPIPVEHCRLDDRTKSIMGKFVVIKAEVFRPEYKRANQQICYVTGGSGAKANPKGKAILVKNVYDGREAQFERSEVQGLVNMSSLPEWAQKAVKKFRKKEIIKKGAAR